MKGTGVPAPLTEAVAAGSSDLSVAGAQEDFTAVESLRPDVVLAAVGPEDLSPARAIVVLSSGTPEWTQEMLCAGGAVLPVNATPPEILAAIHAAAAGRAAIHPRKSRMACSRPAARSASAAPQPLTARELDVLRMMAKGAANKTIAWKLDISGHTVKFYAECIAPTVRATQARS